MFSHINLKISLPVLFQKNKKLTFIEGKITLNIYQLVHKTSF